MRSVNDLSAQIVRLGSSRSDYCPYQMFSAVRMSCDLCRKVTRELETVRCRFSVRIGRFR